MQSSKQTTTTNPLVNSMDKYTNCVTQTENGAFALNQTGMAIEQESSGIRGGSLVAFDQQLIGSRPSPELNTLEKDPVVTKVRNIHLNRKKGNMEGITREQLKKMVNEVMEEGKRLNQYPEQLADSIVHAFHTRDIQMGKGERDLSYWYLLELFYLVPDTMLNKLIPLLVEYGSYLDIVHLASLIKSDLKSYPKKGSYLEKVKHGDKSHFEKEKEKDLGVKLYQALVAFYGESLKKDYNKKPEDRTLSGKWATRINSHFDKKCGFGKDVAKYLFPPKGKGGSFVAESFKKYRKLITGLTDGTCVETAMCRNDWIWIGDNLSKVTGKAQFKYRFAFRDEYIYGYFRGQRRNPYDDDRTYLRNKLEELTQKAIENPAENLMKGGKTLQAYEIVAQYLRGSKIDMSLEAQWKGIVHNLMECRHMKSSLETLINTHISEDGCININPESIKIIKYFHNQVFTKVKGNDMESCVRNLVESFNNKTPIREIESDIQKMLELWNKQSQVFDGDVACCDTSGSMSGLPLEVCISLGLLIQELKSPDDPWKNRVITFSEDPTWHIITGETLYDKVKSLHQAKWGMNTNYAKMMNMILEFAVHNKVEEKYLPKKLWIFTDMQFDKSENTYTGYYNGYYSTPPKSKSVELWATSYSSTKKAFEKAGYSGFPGIVYWNIRSSDTFQCQSNDVGVTTYGGFSQAMFTSTIEAVDVIIKKETPWERLKKTLDSPRYDEVRMILSDSNEGDLSEYTFEKNEDESDGWDVIMDCYE